MTLKRLKRLFRVFCNVEDHKVFINDDYNGWMEIEDIALEEIVIDGKPVEVLMLQTFRGTKPESKP